MAGTDLSEVGSECNVSSRGVTLRDATKGKKRLPRKDAAEQRALDEGGRNSHLQESFIFGYRHTGSLGRWKWWVSRYWDLEVESIDDEEVQRALRKRLESFKTCGRAVSVRRCMDCGTDRLGSGSFRGTRTCKTRSCPVCSQLRAETYSDWVEGAWEKLEPVSGYSWRWLTLTTKYDPTSEEDCSMVGLGLRARACAAAATKVWNRFLSRNPGAGAVRTIEVGRRGHVHCNILYYGPELDATKVQAAVSAVHPSMGHVYLVKVDKNVVGRKKGKVVVEEDDEQDERGSLEGLKRVARYASKGLDHDSSTTDLRNEDWVTGEKMVTTCDPKLAARWEIATYRMHLSQKYGALRGLEHDEHGDKTPDNTDDSKLHCECCGVVGRWKTSYRGTEDWFLKCHIAGIRALQSTSEAWRSAGWGPPPG